MVRNFRSLFGQCRWQSETQAVFECHHHPHQLGMYLLSFQLCNPGLFWATSTLPLTSVSHCIESIAPIHTPYPRCRLSASLLENFSSSQLVFSSSYPSRSLIFFPKGTPKYRCIHTMPLCLKCCSGFSIQG